MSAKPKPNLEPELQPQHAQTQTDTEQMETDRFAVALVLRVGLDKALDYTRRGRDEDDAEIAAMWANVEHAILDEAATVTRVLTRIIDIISKPVLN